MFPYLFVSGIAYCGGMVSVLTRHLSVAGQAMLGLFAVMLCVFIGFRFEVGKDWFQYNHIYDLISEMPLGEALDFTDPGYGGLNWLSYHLGLGATGVFVVCAVILVAGIMMFAAQTPYPWVAVAVTMPHIVTVMAMDHVRQTTALAFILIGLALLARDRVWAFLACVIVGALFHRTGIIVFAFGLVLISKNRVLLYTAFLAIAAVMIEYMLSERLDIYSARYLETEAGSRGALIRLILNAIPAAAFLMLGNRMELSVPFRKVMTIMAWAAIACAIVLPLSPSTVVIDRLGKYFLPVQILFFPMFIARFQGFLPRSLVAGVLVLYLGATQVFWLSNSSLATTYWVPYRSITL
ncbi:EpsG-like putative glucosyltransferase [Yoonia maricola]|uniref:EpsG-like putative glucosyltransferase n=1 Tax=Yoonia maricola TaxID=420999 RepID=A0A2M8W0D8_9RHOB|nr:EpsG family protein [Yoonia maricola]PJI84385.1 EpsG-like putative glucosyltransferase [Yoonia maricola]